MREQDELASLLQEYEISVGQWRTVWQSLGATCTIAVSGIFILILLSFQNADKSLIMFVFLPLIINGWFIMQELQRQELLARYRYLQALESRIRAITRLPVPCYETTCRVIMYFSWRYKLLTVIIAVPFTGLYCVCAWKAAAFLVRFGVPLAAVAVVVYFVLLTLTFVLFVGYDRQLVAEAERLQRDLGATPIDHSYAPQAQIEKANKHGM